jgi:hypothetical protein
MFRILLSPILARIAEISLSEIKFDTSAGSEKKSI